MRKFLKFTGLFIIALLVLGLVWPESRYKPYEVDDAYRVQAEAFHIPDMPPDWKWHDFETKDGTRLRWGETGNRHAAKASIIWVPGYTATLDMYGEHFDLLARKGFHVMGLDLRGQGGSQRYRAKQPEKLWIDDFSTYSSDVKDWIESQRIANDRPLILSGTSFGGHVVARAAGEHELPIDALYLIAPAFKPKSTPYTFEEAMRLMNVSRKLGKAKRYVYGQKDWRPDGLDYTQGSDCSSNPERLYLRDAVFTRRPEQRVGGVTNQWGVEFFESSLFVNQPEFYKKLTVPVTIISAENDTFVVTEENSQACSKYIQDCLEVAIPATGHCLPQESDAVVNQMMDEFDRLLVRASSDRD